MVLRVRHICGRTADDDKLDESHNFLVGVPIEAVLGEQALELLQRGQLAAIDQQLMIELRPGERPPSTTNKLEADRVPWTRRARDDILSEKGGRVVVEVEGLMEVTEDLAEDFVWEDVEVVDGRGWAEKRWLQARGETSEIRKSDGRTGGSDELKTNSVGISCAPYVAGLLPGGREAG